MIQSDTLSTWKQQVIAWVDIEQNDFNKFVHNDHFIRELSPLRDGLHVF
ncbi:MAG: hypothetical protein H0X02_05040 [Nitrosomonas sp.]|nr:hypothetical protein [Nitrosomonas sp.]